MRRGLDSNVLVAAHVPGHPSHAPVRRFLLNAARSSEDTLVVTPLVLHEFVHVVTDPRRFDPPIAMSEALAIAGLYLGRSNVECVAIGEEATRRAFELLDQHQLGRRRIADTLLAAALLTARVEELITCNRSDFEIFEALRVVDPRE